MNMLIHILIIFLLSIGTLLSVDCVLAAEQTNPQGVTAANWDRHPHIIEIRKIYNEIQSKLSKQQLKYQKKDLTALSESCRGTYPMEYIALAADNNSRVRLYTTAQRISHGDLLTTQHYYDSEGHLRFVYMTNKSSEYATIENRVYLDEQGKVFWDVRTEAGKTTFGEITQDPWMIKETTNQGKFADFKSTEIKCRE